MATTSAASAAEKLRLAEAAYREAWEQERLASSLQAVRGSLPNLQAAVRKRKAQLAELRRRLADLERTRREYAEELAALPDDTRKLAGWEADRVRNRRADLREAIAALDGGPAVGTLIDHLRDRPRIAGTRRRIEEAKEQVAKEEAALERARRQLGI